MNNKIVLSTLTATYQHASLGLRYLLANMAELKGQTVIREFTTNTHPRSIVEKILQDDPRILGFGVYIWNAVETLQVVSILKKIRPEIIIVLGGPEVSYETDRQKICELADFVIQGEADFAFRDLCREIIQTGVTNSKIIPAKLPDIKAIQLPYSLYTDHDIQHRVIYVEASRGCPYKCEYCLSSLDKLVRQFPLEELLSDFTRLIEKGCRQFKFIDRTFNLSIPTCTRILEYFLSRPEKDLFLHFEMVPDKLPKEVRELIQKFPKGSIQFEIGIQTWNPEVAARISRRTDFSKACENLKFLAQETGVHTHVDLIVGLPGETMQSFGEGFDRLAALMPDEIQVGILKRLRGTPIIRHDQEFGMIYAETPPYQILQTNHLSFSETQFMSRFAKYWDLIANSGNFVVTMDFIRESLATNSGSLFRFFCELSGFLSTRHGEGIAVSLLNLTESFWIFLKATFPEQASQIDRLIAEDYSIRGRRDLPRFLKNSNERVESAIQKTNSATNKRQQRHDLDSSMKIGLNSAIFQNDPKNWSNHE